MTNNIGTSINSLQGSLHQNFQPVLSNQLNIQGLLTRDGLLHPAFFDIAQSDLLKILDRLTQKSPPKPVSRKNKRQTHGTTDIRLNSAMIGISHMSAQKRGMLFNQAAIDLDAEQLELLYLSAPEEWLSIELISSVGSFSQRSKQEQLYINISSFIDENSGEPKMSDITATNMLKGSLGF